MAMPFEREREELRGARRDNKKGRDQRGIERLVRNGKARGGERRGIRFDMPPLPGNQMSKLALRGLQRTEFGTTNERGDKRGVTRRRRIRHDKEKWNMRGRLPHRNTFPKGIDVGSVA